jgi:hypothetical protein
MSSEGLGEMFEGTLQTCAPLPFSPAYEFLALTFEKFDIAKIEIVGILEL